MAKEDREQHGITNKPPHSPAAVTEKPAVSAPVQTPDPAAIREATAADAVLTGRQMLDGLVSDGTPKAVLKESEEWLKENRNATGENLYRHMEAVGCDGAQGRPSEGTLRKACKIVFGPTAEPAALVSSVPGEEINRLRAENESLRRTLEQKDSQRAVLAKQLELANETKNTAVRQLAVLRGGKTKEELAALGISD